MNIPEYLNRINYLGTPKNDLNTLVALHERHVYNIPFENLDVQNKTNIILEKNHLFKKVVENFRGGFCYELKTKHTADFSNGTILSNNSTPKSGPRPLATSYNIPSREIMKKLIMLLFLIPMGLFAQENQLLIFKSLEDYIWNAEGKWGDGTSFKQEISLEFSLQDKIVKVESKGFTNTEQTEFGLRNHGIRQYDVNLKKIRFWEFDVFGNITEGTVEGNGKDIIYKYDYGGTFVTEMWKYVDDLTYDFIVGVYENGKWKQKFLETKFVGELKPK